jgi:twitching motility two-component system response regulator PilG
MSKTLLVIENDESLVDIVSFYFSEHGYTVYTAADGGEGVAAALRHKPSAIICDMIMGEMHGFDVLRTLRAHPDTKDTVIIITSAKAYKPDIARARELGATEYVVKPFRTAELLELVERHLAAPGHSKA